MDYGARREGGARHGHLWGGAVMVLGALALVASSRGGAETGAFAPTLPNGAGAELTMAGASPLEAARAATATAEALAASDLPPPSATQLAAARAAIPLAQTSPHVLLVTLDDVGFNDLGTTSSDLAHNTPRLSALADSGVRLTSYYGQSICSPARATLMTGKFVHRLGLQYITSEAEITAFSNFSIPVAEDLLPTRLRAIGGYRSIGIGKWNLGHCNAAYLPWSRGFDQFLGYASTGISYLSHVSDPDSTFTYHDKTYTLHDFFEGYEGTGGGPAPRYSGNYSDLVFADAAAAAVREHASSKSTQPLFMWLAFHGPHTDDEATPAPEVPPTAPTTANTNSLTTASPSSVGSSTSSGSGSGAPPILASRLGTGATSAGGGSDAADDDGGAGGGMGAAPAGGDASGMATERRAFASALATTDRAFGLVVDALVEAGMLGLGGGDADRGEANGIVIVHSDNGGFPCASRLAGSNAPLRGCKFNWFEGGVRVPAFVYGPGVVPHTREGGTYAGLMHHVDWTATLMRIAGATSEQMTNYGGTGGTSDSLDHWDGIYNGTSLHSGRTIAFSVGDSFAAIRQGPLKLLSSVANASWFETSWDSIAEQEINPLAGEYCNGNLAQGAPPLLFDVESDPNERHNIATKADRQTSLINLQYLARTIHSEQGYTPPRPHATVESDAANAAFYAGGGYVVPWGCSVQ